MVKHATQTSNQRLLLNAEAFGFGPTAAIADVFPHLRNSFGYIGFAGTGHTLDLQRHLPYDALHDISAPAAGYGLDGLFEQYDLMLTALDFEMAQKAQVAGLPVCIYDPLTWYWKTIHPVVAKFAMYIAQDFYGVRERLAAEAGSFASPQVVAPLVDNVARSCEKGQKILLNLGGLSNPFWSGRETLQYAHLIVESFWGALAGDHEIVVLATNSRIATSLAAYGARNLSRTEMQQVLAEAKYALMTPGLGNIYDAARFSTPTVWLPPANDSQGQQLDCLKAHGLADAAIDWHDLLPQASIDYKGDQQFVLNQIAAAASAAHSDGQASTRLTACFASERTKLGGAQHGICAALLERFGSGGAEQVSELVIQLATRL